MWHPGVTGRQPCGPQNICPDATAFGFFAGFLSSAYALVTARTSAPAKIHFVICCSSLVLPFASFDLAKGSSILAIRPRRIAQALVRQHRLDCPFEHAFGLGDA